MVRWRKKNFINFFLGYLMRTHVYLTNDLPSVSSICYRCYLLKACYKPEIIIFAFLWITFILIFLQRHKNEQYRKLLGENWSIHSSFLSSILSRAVILLNISCKLWSIFLSKTDNCQKLRQIILLAFKHLRMFCKR